MQPPGHGMAMAAGREKEWLDGNVYWTESGSEPISEINLAGTDEEEYVFFDGKRIARRGVARMPCIIVHNGLDVTACLVRYGAGDRDRTGDIQLGKLAFYR